MNSWPTLSVSTESYFGETKDFLTVDDRKDRWEGTLLKAPTDRRRGRVLPRCGFSFANREVPAL